MRIGFTEKHGGFVLSEQDDVRLLDEGRSVERASLLSQSFKRMFGSN